MKVNNKKMFVCAHISNNDIRHIEITIHEMDDIIKDLTSKEKRQALDDVDKIILRNIKLGNIEKAIKIYSKKNYRSSDKRVK